jgi:hypothetical protein
LINFFMASIRAGGPATRKPKAHPTRQYPPCVGETKKPHRKFSNAAFCELKDASRYYR